MTAAAAIDAFATVVPDSLVEEAARALVIAGHRDEVIARLVRMLRERAFPEYEDPKDSFFVAELGDGPDLPQYNMVKALGSLVFVNTWLNPDVFAVTAQMFMAARLITHSPYVDVVAPPVAAHLMLLGAETPGSNGEYDIAASVLMASVAARALERAGPRVRKRSAILRSQGIHDGVFMAQPRETALIADAERAARAVHRRFKTMRELLE